MKMKAFKVKTEAQIDPSMIENLITNALEGGSNYWYTIERRIGPKVGTYAYEQVMEGGGFIVSDSEEAGDAEKKVGRLTRRTCVKAMRLMAKHHPHHLSNLIHENDDAETADVFLQLAVLGEVVYG